MANYFVDEGHPHTYREDSAVRPSWEGLTMHTIERPTDVTHIVHSSVVCGSEIFQ
jgi:hypothetical protein